MTELLSGPPNSDPVSPRRRPLKVLIIVALAVLVLVAGGIGGAFFFEHRAEVAAAEAKDRQEVAAAREKAAAERREEVQRKAEEAEAARLAQVEYDDCVAEWEPALRDLQTIDSRLDVGLNEGKYTDLVGTASVSYDRVNPRDVSDECITSVDDAMSGALNKYIAMASKWNDCLYEDEYCTTKDIESSMQTAWARASGLIDRAGNQLNALDPANQNTV